MKLWRIILNLLILCLALFVAQAGNNMLAPLLPIFMNTLDVGTKSIGLLLTISSLAQLLLYPVWGLLADRMGRKPVLMVGMLGTAVGHLLFGLLGHSFGLALGFRVLSAVFSAAVLPVAIAVIADSISGRKRGAALGLLFAVFNLSILFAPAIGGLTASISLQMPFYLAAGLSLLAGLVILLLKETHALSVDAEISTEIPRISWRPVLFVLLISLLAAAALRGFSTAFNMKMVSALEPGLVQAYAMLMGVEGMASIAGALLLAVLLILLAGEKWAVMVGLAGGGVAMVAASFLSNTALLIPVMALLGFTTATLLPALAALASRWTQQGHGLTQGLRASAAALGMLLGSFAAGKLGDVTPPWVAVLLSGVLMLAALVVCIYWLQRPTEAKASVVEEVLSE